MRGTQASGVVQKTLFCPEGQYFLYILAPVAEATGYLP